MHLVHVLVRKSLDLGNSAGARLRLSHANLLGGCLGLSPAQAGARFGTFRVSTPVPGRPQAKQRCFPDAFLAAIAALPRPLPGAEAELKPGPL